MKNIPTFEKFINEKYEDLNLFEGGGEAAGKMELVKTPVEAAREFAEGAFESNDKNLDSDIPEFDKNYLTVQRIARLGRTKRKDMPVINDEDVDNFKRRLEKGTIDINDPFSPTTDKNKPFPEGLKGFKAKEFLERGLKDGSKTDDIVDVSIEQNKVGDLKPIQQQIYADKSIEATAKFGAEGTTNFLTKKSFFITSSDNYIIDGHHRWLSGNLIDPDMVVNCLTIDMSLDELLPMTKAYGDAIGNKRNK